MVRDYAQVVTDIIAEGIENGEIRDDISPKHLRRIVIGGIEYMILSAIIYHSEIEKQQVFIERFRASATRSTQAKSDSYWML